MDNHATSTPIYNRPCCRTCSGQCAGKQTFVQWVSKSKHYFWNHEPKGHSVVTFWTCFAFKTLPTFGRVLCYLRTSTEFSFSSSLKKQQQAIPAKTNGQPVRWNSRGSEVVQRETKVKQQLLLMFNVSVGVKLPRHCLRYSLPPIHSTGVLGRTSMQIG